MSRIGLRVLAAVTLAAASAPAARLDAQATGTLTFNSLNSNDPSGVRMVGNCYTEGGVRVTVVGVACGDMMSLTTYTSANASWTGSAALFSDVGTQIDFTPVTGPLALFALDLAPISLVPAGTPAFGNLPVTFTGFRIGGGMDAMQTFNLALNATGLTRVTLNGFTNLSSARLTFGGPDFTAQIDNVSVGVTSGVVPEPSTYALMATGLIGLATMARRRRGAQG